VTGDAPGVFADVQMAVIPAVGGHERGNVQTAAAEIRDEDAAPREPRQDRGEAARHDMLLMAVHDRCAAQRLRKRSRDRVGPLTAHVVALEHDDVQLSDLLATRFGAKRHQSCVHTLRHMASELERISFCPTEDAVARIERRWHDVRDRQLNHRGFSQVGARRWPALIRIG